MRLPLKSPTSWLFTQPFIQAQIKKSKLRVTGLCGGNSPVTGEFPSQGASDTETVSTWLCHHDETELIRSLYRIQDDDFYITFQNIFLLLFRDTPQKNWCVIR